MEIKLDIFGNYGTGYKPLYFILGAYLRKRIKVLENTAFHRQ